MKPEDLLETAWGIICNAGAGATHDGTIGWQNESEEWQEAADRFRDNYHDWLSEHVSSREEAPV